MYDIVQLERYQRLMGLIKKRVNKISHELIHRGYGEEGIYGKGFSEQGYEVGIGTWSYGQTSPPKYFHETRIVMTREEIEQFLSA